MLQCCYLLHVTCPLVLKIPLQREKHSILENNGSNGKAPMKPIIYFQAWRVGKSFSGVQFIIGI